MWSLKFILGLQKKKENYYKNAISQIAQLETMPMFISDHTAGEVL